jgi:hypothetical protein
VLWCSGASHVVLQVQPLGTSDKDAAKLEWTRFDHKPEVPWRVSAPPKVFSYLPTLGSGLDASETNKPTYQPPKPLPPHVVVRITCLSNKTRTIWPPSSVSGAACRSTTRLGWHLHAPCCSPSPPLTLSPASLVGTPQLLCCDGLGRR